jgi:hypothetical protein
MRRNIHRFTIDVSRIPNLHRTPLASMLPPQYMTVSSACNPETNHEVLATSSFYYWLAV